MEKMIKAYEVGHEGRSYYSIGDIMLIEVDKGCLKEEIERLLCLKLKNRNIGFEKINSFKEVSLDSVRIKDISVSELVILLNNKG